jgi:hypothetical protein
MFQKLFISLSLLVVLLSSCEKDIGTLGMGIMPSEDILEVRLDSLSNFNFSYFRDNTNDTIRTTQYNLLLGSYIDPIFGKVRSEIYAPIYFNNPVIDTAVYSFELLNANLLITYSDSAFQYGKNVIQTISIFEMQDSINLPDYRTLRFSPRETLLGTFNLKIDTTITTDSVLSIPMPTSFINIIYNYINTKKNKYVYSMASSPEEINKSFSQYFYGIHLKTNFDDASIVKLKDFKIEVKAKVTSKADLSIIDTVTQDLILSDFIDRDNYIYKHPLVSFELIPTKTISDNVGKPNQKRIYIQPMKGYKTDFQFPDIQRWLDTSKIIINIARLTIPIEKSTIFSAISSLTLNIYVKGTSYPIKSFTSQDIEDNDQYVFYVNNFLSLFLKNGRPASDYRYEIVTPNNNLYVNRSVLLPENAKLHLTYTKYK